MRPRTSANLGLTSKTSLTAAARFRIARYCVSSARALRKRASWSTYSRVASRASTVSCSTVLAILRTCVRASSKRSEEHTSELQSQSNLVCRLLLEKKKTNLTRLGVSYGHHHADSRPSRCALH